MISMNQHVGLVHRVARRYLWATEYGALTYDDLFQAGMLGLWEAAKRFDESRDVQFSTYATLWIRRDIVREIQNSGRTIRIPVHAHQEGQMPQHPLSTDIPVGDSDTLLGDLIASADDSPEEQALQNEEKRAVHEIISRIRSPKMKAVMQGLMLDQSQHAVGAQLGISHTTVAKYYRLAQEVVRNQYAVK